MALFPRNGGSLSPKFSSYFLGDEFIPMYYVGILGKDPQNLVAKAGYIGNPSCSEFEYSFIDDGYVGSLYVDECIQENMTFTYK
ncbi:MAG: hypothetical protein LBE79_08500 [Tannerella sp.]|nr:hypothetical protein [Tannerella sp.]